MTCGGGPCKDGLGSPVLAGEIFDPLSVSADGYTRLPFPNNTIPANRMDPVAVKILGFLPKPVNSLQSHELSAIRSDSQTTEPPFGEARPQRITRAETLRLLFVCGRIGSNQHGRLAIEHHHGRLQYQPFQHGAPERGHTLRPSMLLHFGVGYVIHDRHQLSSSRMLSAFNAESSARTDGGHHRRLSSDERSRELLGERRPIGGMTSNFGPTYHQEPDTGEFSSLASLSWVKGSHTYKFGGSMHTRMEAFNPAGRLGRVTFSFSAQTGQPFGAGGVALATTNGCPASALPASFSECRIR